MPAVFSRSTSLRIWPRPSSAMYSHCRAMSRWSAAARLFIESMPSAGGQSMMMTR